MGAIGKMKTLLRKISTGLYLRAPGQWTSNPWEALDFESIDGALQFIRSLHLTDVEMAFAFSGAGQVTAVPLERLALPYCPD